MKLLFAANLKGRPRSYNALVSRAEDFTAMFWLGDLIDSALPNTGEQRVRLIQAAGEIQSRGCRVLASGPQADVLDLCHWFRDSGTFIAPGFIVTRQFAPEPDRAKLMELREAAWSADSIWIVLADNPRAIEALDESRHGDWPEPRFAPDVIVTCRNHRDIAKRDWCERRADTWVLTPNAPSRSRYAEIAFDLRKKRVVWTSGKRTERRDVSALLRADAARMEDRLAQVA